MAKVLQFPKDFELQVEDARAKALEHNASNKTLETLQACKSEYILALTYANQYKDAPASVEGCLFIGLYRSSTRKLESIKNRDYDKVRKNGNMAIAQAILAEKSDAVKLAKISARETLRKTHNIEVNKNKAAAK